MEAEYNGGCQEMGEGNEELLFNGYEVLVMQPRANNTELLIYFDAKGPALC